MAFTPAIHKAMLDAHLVSGDHIAYSTNGTSATTALARTPVGSWSPATTATPAVKANAATITTAASTAAATITHFAVFSAATGGTQKTLWVRLENDRTLGVGDQMVFAAGSLGLELEPKAN